MTSVVTVASTRGEAQRATTVSDNAALMDLMLVSSTPEEFWCATIVSRDTSECAPVGEQCGCS